MIETSLEAAKTALASRLFDVLRVRGFAVDPAVTVEVVDAALEASAWPALAEAYASADSAAAALSESEPPPDLSTRVTAWNTRRETIADDPILGGLVYGGEA